LSKQPRVKTRGIAASGYTRPTSSDNFIYGLKPVELRQNIKLKPTLDGFNFIPVLVDIPSERIPDIIALIEYQCDRLIKDLSVKNELVTDFDIEYDLGKTYELGVDFP